MIDSADVSQAFNKDLVTRVSEQARMRKIAKYVNAEIMYVTQPGGSIELLEHFVAVSKVDKAVVLAIRGTYSLSGLQIDAAAYNKPFLGGVGVAHSGMAERTDFLWDHAKDTILEALKNNPGYDFIISGHSLGAGTSALLALQLNYDAFFAKHGDELLKHVKVKCFAFAPPPVFVQTDNTKITVLKVKDAIANTSAFIHENDCVLFMSIDAVRRLANMMTLVGAKTVCKPVRRLLMAADQIKIPQDVVDIAVSGSTYMLPAVNDAQRLATPAPYVVWMRNFDVDDNDLPQFDAMLCRPHLDSILKGTNDLSILLHRSMISDHMNPMYERAVNSVLEQIVKHKKPGYVFPV
jgi:hypothetical protein